MSGWLTFSKGAKSLQNNSPNIRDKMTGAEGMKSKCSAYLVLVVLAASLLAFYKLGEPTLGNDEALYARIVNNINSSGDWLSLKFYGIHYTHKPPLYFWLTAATYNLFNDEETRIRLWSAVFGVGCALLTFLLGCVMFSPEIGLFAALILSMNRSFLFLHGVRQGTMDSGVTFFTLVALLVLWKLPKLRQPLLGWIAIGLCVGIMCMLKPLIGILLFIPMIIHWEIYHKPGSWRSRSVGPMIALLTSILLFPPWHLFALKTVGSTHYMETAFGINLLKRATVGIDPAHIRGLFYYWEAISKSSVPFLLFIPALAGSILLACVGSEKRAFGLISIVTLFCVAAFSLSVSKLPWYMYPVFPLISLAIAGLIVSVPQLLWVGRRVPVSEIKLSAWVIVVGCSIAFGNLIYLVSNKIPQVVAERQYVPLALYQYAGPEKIATARFIFLNYPGNYLHHTITYYSSRFANAAHLDNATQLDKLLKQEGPIVIVIGKCIPDDQVQHIEEKLNSFNVLQFKGYWGTALARDIEDNIPQWLRNRAKPITFSKRNF